MRERDQLRGAGTSWRDLLADLFESVATWDWLQRQQSWYDARGMAAPWRSVGLHNQRWHDVCVAVALAQSGRALAWQQPQTQFLGHCIAAVLSAVTAAPDTTATAGVTAAAGVTASALGCTEIVLLASFAMARGGRNGKQV